jgi:hypothetical protein
VSFRQEREQDINELFADLQGAYLEEPERDVGNRWHQLSSLWREYSDEIARSGMNRRAMIKRVNALLEKGWQRRRQRSPIEHFEVVGLLRVFAAEAIREGRDTDVDMKAFMNEWDTNHRGITVQLVATAAWTSAHDEVVGEEVRPS